MSNVTSALFVSDLVAGYGDREVLHSISVNVEKAKTFGLIGLNGAGKTTLIKILLGLKNQTSGNALIFGQNVSSPEVKMDVSYLPERFDPPWFLTGAEFVKFSAKLYNRNVSEEAIEDFARRLALDPTAMKRKVQTYSKGMRQKLGLIATILTGCSLLILDEPMSGLDPLARALVKNCLMELKAEGRTVILSSHILADMDEICDDISVLHDGVIHYSGTPSGFKNKMGENSLEKSFLHVVQPKTGAAA